MEIEPIKTPADHAAALREIDGLMSAELGTPEGDRLNVLVALVETYESKHFPIGTTKSVESIPARRSNP